MLKLNLDCDTLAELVHGAGTDDYEYITEQFVGKSRWSVDKLIVIEYQGQKYGAIVQFPATENQYMTDDDLPTEWYPVEEVITTEYRLVKNG